MSPSPTVQPPDNPAAVAAYRAYLRRNAYPSQREYEQLMQARIAQPELVTVIDMRRPEAIDERLRRNGFDDHLQGVG